MYSCRVMSRPHPGLRQEPCQQSVEWLRGEMQGDAETGSEVGRSAEGGTETPRRVPKPLGLLQTGLMKRRCARGRGKCLFWHLAWSGPQTPWCPPGGS